MSQLIYTIRSTGWITVSNQEKKRGKPVFIVFFGLVLYEESYSALVHQTVA